MTFFFLGSSVIMCFHNMLLRYFMNDFALVPVAPIIAGFTFVFIFQINCITIVRFLYFRIFSASFLITFLCPEIAASINIHVPISLSSIMMSGVLLGFALVDSIIFVVVVVVGGWVVVSVCL